MPKSLRLVALALLFGCPVQEPAPGTPDFGLQPEDAGLDCTQAPSLCVRGERCDPSTRTCVENLSCTAHGDCRADRRCVDGLCGLPPGACTVDQDCGTSQHCAPSGVCVGDADPSGRFLPVCSDAADCTVGTQCAEGLCAPCGPELACPGAQVCRRGRCEEPATCRSAADCYAGHVCTRSLCVRPTDGCNPDPENDQIEGATPLSEMHVSGLELCGLDRDWYALRLQPFVGARFIITPEPSAARTQVQLETEVTTDRGEPISGVSTLHWPGRTIIQVPGRDAMRELRLSISGNQGARYSLDTERVFGLCAGDELDLYGDQTPETAPILNLVRLGELSAVACPEDLDHVRLPVREDELVRLGLELEPEQAARLELSITDPNRGASWTRTFTASVTEPLALPRAQADTELVLRTSAVRAPELGASYRWRPDLESAGRFQACEDPPSAPASATLDLAGGTALGLSSCGAGAGFRAETILRLVPAVAPSLLRATVRPAGSATALVGVRLLSECMRDSTERSCDASPRPGLGASIEHVATTTAPLFLVVSTSEPTSGVSFSYGFDENDNFTCVGGRSTPIESSGVTSVSTVEGTHSLELGPGSSCGFSGVGSGPDRFFELDVAARQVVVLELTGRTDGFLWVGTNCARLSETCTAAASIDDIVSPARVVLEPGRATRYVVAVDGYGPGDAGDYELRTLFSPECLIDAACPVGERCDDYVCAPPPANNQCPGTALILSDGVASASGSTNAGTDDFDSADCFGGALGNDVVFRLELAAPASSFVARVTRANFDPLMYLRRNLCESRAAEIVCNDDRDLSAGDLLPEIRLANVPAGTYYLIVDAYSFGSPTRGGTFELEVQVTP